MSDPGIGHRTAEYPDECWACRKEWWDERGMVPADEQARRVEL